MILYRDYIDIFSVLKHRVVVIVTFRQSFFSNLCAQCNCGFAPTLFTVARTVCWESILGMRQTSQSLQHFRINSTEIPKKGSKVGRNDRGHNIVVNWNLKLLEAEALKATFPITWRSQGAKGPYPARVTVVST